MSGGASVRTDSGVGQGAGEVSASSILEHIGQVLEEPEVPRSLDEGGVAVGALLSQVASHGRRNADVRFALPEVEGGFDLV